MKRIVSVLAFAGIAGAASGQTWVEVPDADGLVPQATSGVGALSRIEGVLGNNPGGVDNEDMFCIYIAEPAMFRATTVGTGTGFDTQLFLFTAGGMGVAFNDDSASSPQSTLTSLFVTTPGYYNLAITAYNWDASSAGGLIWNNTPFGTERAPDGPGAAGALASWGGTSFTANPSLYAITLSGAEFCVPAPSAAALLGIGGLLAARRRR